VLPHKVIGVLGVAFKANTDDIRGAPSLAIIPRLHGAGAILRIYDPIAARNFQKLYPPDDRLTYVESAFEAARGADALVILTEWDEFRTLDLDTIRSLVRTPIVVDAGISSSRHGCGRQASSTTASAAGTRASRGAAAGAHMSAHRSPATVVITGAAGFLVRTSATIS